MSKKIEKKIEKNQEIEAAKATLKKILAENPKEIYTLIRKVSPSGMSRSISLLIVQNGQIIDLSYYAALSLGWRLDKSGSVIVSGCGMDMKAHLVDLIYRSIGMNWDQKTPYIRSL